MQVFPRYEEISQDVGIWYPFTQHQGALEPMQIESAFGSYLYTDKKQAVFDAISSWWVCLHGHCHPELIDAAYQQMRKLDHVMFAQCTHEPAYDLVKQLLEITPKSLQRVFFSDNGSTAVEVSLKIALQYFYLRRENRNKFFALAGAYHGDTFGAMAVGERGVFNQPFSQQLMEVTHLKLPQSEEEWAQMESFIAEQGHQYAGFIYEPLVQGAGGMLMHCSKDLDRLMRACKKEGVLLIADEVMTGFHRTGQTFASQMVNTQPDLMCLAKGLTGGTLPLAVTLCREHIFSEFLSAKKEDAFFHGHSFTGNPTTCAIALKSIEILQRPETYKQIKVIENSLNAFAQTLRKNYEPEKVKNTRQQGAILAFDLLNREKTGYFNSLARNAMHYFPQHGVLLRPLGNTLYFIPPYSSTKEDLEQAFAVVEKFIQEQV